MEFKVITMIIIPILSAVLIQLVVLVAAEPDEQAKTLGDEAAQSKFRKLLDYEENFKKVVEVLTTAVKSTSKAKKKAQKYAKEELGDDMKILLEKVAKYPMDIGRELGPKVAELHKKLDEDYKTYRTVFTPFAHLAKKCGYMLLRGIGFSTYTLGDLIEAFEDATRESRNSYRDGKGPGKKTDAALKAMHKGADALRTKGTEISDKGDKGLKKSRNQNNNKQNSTPNSPTFENNSPDKREDYSAAKHDGN